jgi:hypothetical protein
MQLQYRMFNMLIPVSVLNNPASFQILFCISADVKNEPNSVVRLGAPAFVLMFL